MIHSQKNCIIIHGCEYDQENAIQLTQRTAENHWTMWIKEELIKESIMADAPLMPFSWAPDYEKFKTKLQQYDVNEKTILVGHSCACAFLVRWLGESQRSIAKLILVAPWKIANKDDSGRVSFYTYDIDTAITKRVEDIVIFTADDESEDGKKSVEIFHDALGGRVIELTGKGHYRTSELGTSTFPELLHEIMR